MVRGYSLKFIIFVLGLTQTRVNETKLTHEDYCQFLLVSQTNFTQTYFADHREDVSHDDLNRMMRQAKLSPRDLRERVRSELILSANGYMLFDDVVLDKNHSFAIVMVKARLTMFWRCGEP